MIKKHYDMRHHQLIVSAIFALALSSCFKDEAPNAECDIIEACLHVDNPTDIFYNPTDTLVRVLYTDDNISFSVRRKADLTSLAPTFRITDGATISPASGSVHDFSKGPVIYTVTSEDKEWSRSYKVSFIPVIRTSKDTLSFNFEDYHLDSKGKYYIWCEKHEDGNMYDDWATGNAGYGLTNGSAGPEAYPSTVLDEGYEGKGVKLVTCSTGPFGQMVKLPLAAGNLFLGTFDMSIALKTPRLATGFGLPFDKKPKTFTGYYKYTPGEKFQNKDESIVEGKVDEASVYAILYRNHDEDGNPVVLNGDNVQTSPLIVAKAIAANIVPTDKWTQFTVDFSYLEDFDLDLLENRGYNLAVVFSSSADGAFFQGAIGSTLCIDNVKIICETVE
ncbi:PCMD domain-containing protein [Prevotella sp. P3-122]|uniref:PCMD domain-containing protein n=1 Tax=Prevotella sp. P3-122 TaxID=2024223 RepID=UPI001F0A54CB|nr:PCMD domain-containing protein [Prevotella sp. P3-122]